MNGKKLGWQRERGGRVALRAGRRGALKPLVCALMLAAPAAQADEAAEAAAERSAARTLAPITVSANPLGLDLNSTTLPASVLEGDALIEQRNGTLGDTLKNLPGVNSDTFGGGASRPVIRGQTAPRVKVLSDGSEVMDASSISPDHDVTVEPLLAERIEVLRGPATLLYGGGAIGGVVNVVDKKIPTAVPEKGIEAEAELRGATGTKERAGAVGITAGEGQFAVRVEGLKRRTSDYDVPDWPGGKLEGSRNTWNATLLTRNGARSTSASGTKRFKTRHTPTTNCVSPIKGIM